jgi:glycerate 2-kinase
VTNLDTLRDDARTIWQAAVDAARPQTLIPLAFADPNLPLQTDLRNASKILVVGAGKAGVSMAQAVETELRDALDRVVGLVNVPDDPAGLPALQRIRLHPARPAATNQPTAAGVEGAEKILELMKTAGPDDVALCLISGGGSALLPAPVAGISLEDKQHVTKLLHSCGATINEMNAVRKHLSAIKGGRLAQAFSGRVLVSLIISDVIGDPLDVIASGPTAADPSTFGDALAVLGKYALIGQTPPPIVQHLERGSRGEIPETPKALTPHVHNCILGNNAKSLAAAEAKAKELGYPVLNFGSYLEGETREIGIALAGLLRAIRHQGRPVPPPVCVLSGGETTVTLRDNHGLGGRNQELVLAMLVKLGQEGMGNTVLLSGGTDGEDGPTDAAGACADARTLAKAQALGLNAAEFLGRNDGYHFFEATGDLLKTGLTQTNVMDVRVMLLL